MAEFIEVASRQDISSGQMKPVNAGGHTLVIARAGNDFYAADNACPHMSANLSKGKLDGTVITCPVHHSQFDLKDGRVVRWTDWTGILLSLGKLARSPRPLKTYRVKVEGDKIFVEMEKVPVR